MTSTNTAPELSTAGSLLPALEVPVDKVLLPFAPMPLPSRHLKEDNWNSYRIYKTETEFVTVEGEAAYDAIAKSGVANPVRVVRTMKELGDVLTGEQLLEKTEPDQKPEAEVPKSGIIAPPAAASAEAPPAA